MANSLQTWRAKERKKAVNWNLGMLWLWWGFDVQQFKENQKKLKKIQSYFVS